MNLIISYKRLILMIAVVLFFGGGDAIDDLPMVS